MWAKIIDKAQSCRNSLSCGSVLTIVDQAADLLCSLYSI
jgi:hypothetical protein